MLGSSGSPLGDVQLEHTIVKLCVHLLGIRIVREAETAPKAPIGPLNTVIFSDFFLPFKLTLARKNEYAVF